MAVSAETVWGALTVTMRLLIGLPSFAPSVAASALSESGFIVRAGKASSTSNGPPLSESPLVMSSIVRPCAAHVSSSASLWKRRVMGGRFGIRLKACATRLPILPVPRI